jgi:nicotinamide phosphoribosyltransferase
MKVNALTAIDFYKTDHRRQYPEGTEYVYSNFTPRSGKHSNMPNNEGIIFFGLQGFIKWFLKDCWDETFFNQPKHEVVREYQKRMDGSLGEGSINTKHIEDLHDLGYLPIKIKALPEGSFVPYNIPVFTIINTKPEFFWLTNYLETIMSAELWKACTSATTANAYRKEFERHANKVGYQHGVIDFQGHDFSMRGMGGIQDAMSSGAGHLISFKGTDTVCAIDYLENYYNADYKSTGHSVCATEHSVMCMGTKESEIETFRKLIVDLYPTGIVSIVSDTWDLWEVLNKYLPKLKEAIMDRNGKVVIRPDSGDPVDIICGNKEIIDLSNDCADLASATYMAENTLREKACDIAYIDATYCNSELECSVLFKWNDKYYKLTGTFYIGICKGINQIETSKFHDVYKYTPTIQSIGAYESLWNTFGGKFNDMGYKVLNDCVGLIYGDAITFERQKEILRRLENKGFSASNLVLGIGSYTYTYVTRDTHGFAMKATWGQVNGEGREIFKNPVTDDGMKKSAKGLLRVDRVDGLYKLTDQVTKEEEQGGELRVVFEDGNLYNEQNLDDVRYRVKSLIKL